ncbi:MAG: hypothetical protein R3C56_28925 [Pirellulaceae bacterium]
MGWGVDSYLLALVLPLTAMTLRTAEIGPSPNYWEPLWLSGWELCELRMAGLWLAGGRAKCGARYAAGTLGLILTGVCVGTLGWTWQSVEYYNNFLWVITTLGIRRKAMPIRPMAM